MQLLKLAPTLLKLHSDDVYHFGALPEGCHGPGDNSLIANAGNALMVGEFTHEDGSRWVLVVNRDLEKSRPCHPTFRQRPKRIEMVSPYMGQLIPYDGEQRWLAAGQGVLLMVEN